MNAPELEASARGRSITIGEHEIARGLKEMERQLTEMRKVHPELKVLQKYDGIPIATVKIVFRGVWTDVGIDPLNLGERLGLRDNLPPVPDYMQADPADPASPWSEA